MINDEQGKILYDKASRGQQLSEVEQQQLEEWYAYQDRLELEAIQLPTNDSISWLIFPNHQKIRSCGITPRILYSTLHCSGQRHLTPTYSDWKIHHSSASA
jgi:hypothetical protein